MTAAALHDRSGRCLCGGVRFHVSRLPADLHACHCDNCRRITGICSLAVKIAAQDITITGDDLVASYPSSDWASRSFCSRCGSGLWFRMTAEPEAADYYLSAGLLDNRNGLRLVEEIYVDRKPDGYAFAGPAERLTGADFEARLAGHASGPASSPEETP